jgi:hypothetical protein
MEDQGAIPASTEKYVGFQGCSGANGIIPGSRGNGVGGDRQTVSVTLRLFNDRRLNNGVTRRCMSVSVAPPRLPDSSS